MHGIGDNADSIGHQLDINNDTILFKYSLFSKDEVTPTVKSSMQEFGKLLSDNLFNDRLLKVMAYNIIDTVEYLSYTFGANNTKKDTSSTNTSILTKSKSSERKDSVNMIKQVSSKPKLNEQDEIYNGILHSHIKYLEAEFPGGDSALAKYLFKCGLNKEFVKEKSIPTGDYPVDVSFTVDETGHLMNLQLSNSLYNYGLSQKIVECLKNGPLWQPGKVASGRFVKSPYMIYFRLKVRDGSINMLMGGNPYLGE